MKVNNVDKRHSQEHHGMSGLPEYDVWKALFQRCYNPSCKIYHRYGGRGIKVCKRWSSFTNFLVDMGKRPPGRYLYKIERLDNNGDYTPKNCIWALPAVQNRNHRRNRNLTAFGRTQCLTDWATEVGLHPSTIYQRLMAGLKPEQAITSTRFKHGGVKRQSPTMRSTVNARNIN